ncbi:hypothetical protein RISK_005022 [Rhodopirellula islandica]|uniref:Uncharacterized protein n=1 Tax=Rhodopirellula islandica TaxID=595434 RepID=A0A0J1B8E5_RHOIS|nr:hypothetical protein RISK_005022 [Rhodopirellula islandica]
MEQYTVTGPIAAVEEFPTSLQRRFRYPRYLTDVDEGGEQSDAHESPSRGS